MYIKYFSAVYLFSLVWFSDKIQYFYMIQYFSSSFIVQIRQIYENRLKQFVSFYNTFLIFLWDAELKCYIYVPVFFEHKINPVSVSYS